MYDEIVRVRVISGEIDEYAAPVTMQVVRNSPPTLFRPCPCGCDEAAFPGIVGYQRTIKDGRFATILIYDEKVFKLLAKVIHAIE